MPDIPIRSTVSALSTYLFENIPGNLTSTSPSQIATAVIEGLLNTYVSLYSTAALPLTAVQPDYEANVAELQSLLNNSEDPGWNVTTTASTGQAVVGMVATAQTFNQFSVERALQESMLDFAQLPSSIYTICRMLGVTIARRQPAICPVTISLPVAQVSTVTIAAYSQQFGINSQDYFNRNSIIIPAGQTSVTATLYQGTISTLSVNSNGQPNQTFSLGDNDFTISNSDIVCSVNNVIWTQTESTIFYSTGLWQYGANSTVFYATTDASGNAQIVFGNGTYGAIPTVNTPIQFTYCTTTGSSGNIDNTGYNFSFSQIINGSLVNLTGTVTGPSTGGLNERQPQEYAIIGPATYSAKASPVTLSDYNVFMLNYPGGGIIDAYCEGQQQFAPNNLNYMMVIRVTLLTNSNIVFSDVVNWITGQGPYLNTNPPYAGANLQFIPNNSQAVTIGGSTGIVANVYCTDIIPLTTLQNTIQSSLNTAFTLRAGWLGYSIYQSDIEQIILNSDSNGNIQYVQLESPNIDYILDNYQYAVLGSITLNMYVSNRKFEL